MAETTRTNGQTVQAPESGQTVVVNAIPGQDILLEAAFDQAEVKMEGGNVVFAFANGGQVVLDFTDLDAAQAPNVVMADGSVLNMQEYLAALGEGEVEPAAGPDAGGADSGGVGEYQDDAGNLIDGVDKLNGLDPRDFTSITVEALEADDLEEAPVPEGSEPTVSVTSGFVEEKGLQPDGTSAGDGSNTTNGLFSIDAGGAGLGLLEIQDKDGNWVNVTGGGSVNGANGVLTVAVVDGAYSWTYELQNNLLTHDDTTFGDGDGLSGADDQQPGEAFSVRVVDGNGAVSPEVLLNISVYDDAPEIRPVDSEESQENAVFYASLEEESAPDGEDGVIGNDEADGLSHTTGVQSMTGAVNWGADGFGSLVGVQVDGGEMINLGDADSVTVYFDADGGVLPDATGSAAMMEVFADGEYQLTVTGAMNHAPGEGENWLELPSITFTGVDGDGDPASVSLMARIQDDVPEVIQTEGQEGLEDTILYASLEEESVPDGEGGVIGNNEADGLSHATGVQSMTGAVNWGADGFGSLVGVQVDGGEMINLGDADSVTVYFDADGGVLPDATGSAAMMEVFANGEYQLTVTGAMNHAPGEGENWLELPSITFTGVDGDGDPASVSLMARIQDDVPEVIQTEGQEGLEDTILYASLEEESVPDGEGGVIGNNEADGLSHTTGVQSMIGAVNWGADGFGSLVGVQVDGGEMINLGDADSVTVYFDADGGVLPGVTGSAAMMEVFANGEYQLTVTGAMNHAPGDGLGGPIGENLLELPRITFMGVDGDGDPASVSLVASVQDDVPIVDISSTVSSVLSLTNHAANAGYDNSFGYYIKDADGNPSEGMVIWDNVKDFTEGSLTIDGYTPDQIGFFIIPNGDELNAGLESGTPVTFQFVAGQWQAFANGAPLAGEDTHVLFDVADFNKDGLNHVTDNADIGNLNWEDVFRGGDKDYNDVNITAEWTVKQTGSLGEFGADGGQVVIDGVEPDGDGNLVVTGTHGSVLTVDTETAGYEIESQFLHSYDTPPPADSFDFSLVDGDNDEASATLNAMMQQNNPG